MTAEQHFKLAYGEMVAELAALRSALEEVAAERDEAQAGLMRLQGGTARAGGVPRAAEAASPP